MVAKSFAQNHSHKIILHLHKFIDFSLCCYLIMKLFCLLLTFAALVVPTLASTEVLEATDVEDTVIAMWNPTINWSKRKLFIMNKSWRGGPSYGFLKFNTLPSSENMLKMAELCLFTQGSSSGIALGHRILSNWNEMSTWISLNGSPMVDRPRSFSRRRPRAKTEYCFDVTSDVKAWMNGSAMNYGWLLSVNNDDNWTVRSSETNKPPKLTLTFVPPTSAPSPAPMEQTVDLIASEDTEIWQTNPDVSYGSAISISVDKSSGGSPSIGLIKFDVSSIPSDANVIALLRMYTVNPSPGPVAAYKMPVDWSESSTWNSVLNSSCRKQSSQVLS